MSVKTHQQCPKCGHNECATIFEDGGTYCHSECGYIAPEGGRKGFERFAPSGHPMGELEWKHSAYRKVTLETAQRLNILTGYNKDGKERARLYPYPHRPKMRILPKDFSQNQGFTNDHLIGMDLVNAGSSKAITIVEGEDDWAITNQILHAKGGWPVVGIPGASVSHALLKNCKEWLDKFEMIIIATDGDSAGDVAANKLATVFPNKCYRVSMTKYKDPMAYAENDAEKEWYHAWVNRRKYVAPFDTSTPEQFLKLFHESKDKAYVPTGIQGYDEIGLGLFQGEFTVFTAPEGVGKTELMRMLEYGLIRDHPGLPFAFCHLEETQQRSLLGLCSYHLGKNVTRKDLIEDPQEVEKAIDDMMGGENIHMFKIGTDEGADELINRVKYYANVCDCKYIFFEPIQDIMHQRQDASSSVEFLDKLAVSLARTAAETGCGIITIAHMNDSGQIRDSRMLQKQASVRVDLERNIDSSDEEERNKTRMYIRKNRPVGPTGFAGEVSFDPHSFTLQETTY